MKKIYLILVLLPGFLSLVISQETFRLQALAPAGHIVNGREYIPLSSEQLRVELAYDGTSEENLVFDLVVFNETGRKITVKPPGFYYVTLPDPDADSSQSPPCMAVNPGQVYKWYDRALEEQESHKSMNSFLGLVEAGVGILSGTAAFLSTDNPAYIVDAVFNTAGTAGHYISMNRQIEEEMDQTAAEKEMIHLEMMREGELEPGGITNGFVCFPGQPEGSYFMFCFPIDDQEFQFVYQLLAEK